MGYRLNGRTMFCTHFMWVQLPLSPNIEVEIKKEKIIKI